MYKEKFIDDGLCSVLSRSPFVCLVGITSDRRETKGRLDLKGSTALSLVAY